MKYIFSICLLMSTFFCVHGQEKKKNRKQDIKVLYVGGSANWQKEHFASDEEMRSDIIRRTASFVDLFCQYFTTVKAIDAKEYKQKMSDDFDVTVFDGTPNQISARKPITDSAGKLVNYKPAAYLTEDFDKPVIFIAELGDQLGRSIGFKGDWYCLCMDAHAHNFRKEHPIFNKPFTVKLTTETRPTPEVAFHYQYFSEKKYPQTLPMWRVQTKGYITDEYFRVGMVARPWGFEDSPDAEYISSGVCTKTLDAVAIGRHGNFFEWGFAASPEFMTEEAKVVLANAVVYISGFNGKGIIARKFTDRRATREYLKEKKYLASRQAWEENKTMYENFNKDGMARKQNAEAKKAKGKSLTAEENRFLQFQPPKMESFEDYVKKNQGEMLFAKYGTNENAYAKYYDENKDYFYALDALYKIEVDEDVKSLGIPNYDKRLLDKAISLLEKGEDTAKARRILERYTLANFSSPTEWRRWYEKYKDVMFFTETGGYYFMINTNDKKVEGNDYKKKSTIQVISAIRTSETSDLEPVSVAAGLIDKDSNLKEVIVKMKIHPGYHVYANVAKTDPYTMTKVDVKVSDNYSLLGEQKKPVFQPFNESGTTIYEKEVSFVQSITGSGKGSVECIIYYQCCDDHICYPPVEKKVLLNLQ